MKNVSLCIQKMNVYLEMEEANAAMGMIRGSFVVSLTNFFSVGSQHMYEYLVRLRVCSKPTLEIYRCGYYK